MVTAVLSPKHMHKLVVFALILFISILANARPGAVYAASFTVNSTADAVDATPGDGLCETATPNQCTLRAAIQEANALAGADSITVPVGTYTLSIAGTAENAAATGDLDITSDVTITGAGTTIVDGNGLDRVFETLSGANATIENMTIQGGFGNGTWTSGAGNAMFIGNSTITLRDVVVRNNTGSGSLMYVINSTATLLRTAVINNDNNGIQADSSSINTTLNVINSTISGNTGVGIHTTVNSAVNTTLEFRVQW